MEKYTIRSAPQIQKVPQVTPTAKQFTVSKVFSDNMILQRDEYIRICGYADESENGNIVCAEFMGLYGSAKIENGEWKLVLDGTLPACNSKGNKLRVYGVDTEYVYNDVLVGDVYLVAGQSNAAYSVERCLDAWKDDENYNKIFTQEDINDTDNIRIMLNRPGLIAYPPGNQSLTISKDLTHTRGWQIPSSLALKASALGYYFAKQIIAQTNNQVPIGIIDCSLAAAALSAFISKEAAEKSNSDVYDEERGGYYTESVVGLQTARTIFNHCINPFMNYTISAMIWYQGESDCFPKLYETYPKRFTAMAEDYRAKINQNYYDFPVLIVELPSEWKKPADYEKGDWAHIEFGFTRSYMGLIPTMLPNCFIAPGSDVWKVKTYPNSLHPYCKWAQAEYLKEIALSMFYTEYSDNKIDYVAAPCFVKADILSENAVRVYFSHTGDGLKVINGDSARGIEVLVENNWVPAGNVVVNSNYIEVSHGSKFTALRYFTQSDLSFPEDINICSSSGIPMASFILTTQNL